MRTRIGWVKTCILLLVPYMTGHSDEIEAIGIYTMQQEFHKAKSWAFALFYKRTFGAVML